MTNDRPPDNRPLSYGGAGGEYYWNRSKTISEKDGIHYARYEINRLIPGRDNHYLGHMFIPVEHEAAFAKFVYWSSKGPPRWWRRLLARVVNIAAYTSDRE